MLKPLLIAILALAVVTAVVFVGGKYLGKEAADETAGWKTYRNEEYGFEFRYPPYYEVEEFEDIIDSEQSNRGVAIVGGGIEVLRVSINNSIYVGGAPTEIYERDKLVTAGADSVDKIKGYTYQSLDKSPETYFIEYRFNSKGNNYQVTTTNRLTRLPWGDEFENIFDKIVLSFKTF